MKNNNIGNRLKMSIIGIFFILILALMFLFALNGRYMKTSSGLIYDKWKGEAYQAGSEEIPFILNGKDFYNDSH